MGSDTGHDYFARREAQERLVAERSDDPTAKRIHLDLADRYADLVSEAVATPPAAAV